MTIPLLLMIFFPVSLIYCFLVDDHFEKLGLIWMIIAIVLFVFDAPGHSGYSNDTAPCVRVMYGCE